MKKFTFIFFFLLSVNLFAQIPTNGLVAWYPFTGNPNDQSGNNLNPGSNTATATTDRYGSTGKAYYFNGSNSFMVIPANPLLNLKDSLTISLWCNIDFTKTAGTGHHLIVKGSNSSQEYSIVVDQNSRKIGFNKQSNQTIVLSNTVIQNNTWTHIAVTYKYPTAKLYINGILDVTGTINSPFTSSNTSLSIGTINALAGADVTKGKLDDIVFYNRELKASEVNSLFYSSGCTFYDTNYVTVTDTLVIKATVTTIAPPNNQNTFKVYPNPSNSAVVIDNGNFSMMNNYRLKIYNSVGAEVYNSLINQQQFTVNFTTLGGTGTYFLRLIDPTNNVIENKTVIIE